MKRGILTILIVLITFVSFPSLYGQESSEELGKFVIDVFKSQKSESIREYLLEVEDVLAVTELMGQKLSEDQKKVIIRKCEYHNKEFLLEIDYLLKDRAEELELDWNTIKFKKAVLNKKEEVLSPEVIASGMDVFFSSGNANYKLTLNAIIKVKNKWYLGGGGRRPVIDKL